MYTDPDLSTSHSINIDNVKLQYLVKTGGSDIGNNYRQRSVI